ncbi:MAG: flagellar motor switch protein FliM [Chloroflexota bacterium]
MFTTDEGAPSAGELEATMAMVADLRQMELSEIQRAAAERQEALFRKDVKEYDFRRPEKFSREQLRTLQGIHEQFVRLLNSSLAGYLRAPIQFALEGVQQATYQAFTADAKETNLIFVVSLDPLPAPILVEVSAELVFASLDRMLGGAGRRFKRERDATELERALFQENWLMPVLENLRTAWQSIIAITPVVAAVETIGNFVHIALPGDVVVVMEASATISDARGMVRLCYTYAALEPIAPQLDLQRLIAPGASRRRPEDSEQVRRGLNTIRVPVVVRLGTADVAMAELLDLQAGDVIRIGTLVDEDVELLVNGVPKYHGRPGLKKQRLAVRVSGMIKEHIEQGDGNGI